MGEYTGSYSEVTGECNYSVDDICYTSILSIVCHGPVTDNTQSSLPVKLVSFTNL